MKVDTWKTTMLSTASLYVNEVGSSGHEERTKQAAKGSDR